MVGSGERAQPEPVAIHVATGLRVLDTARRALISRNAALAHVVLAFEGEARSRRGDLVGERLIDCAMRVGELARVAWRRDREPPDEHDVRRLIRSLEGVIEDAPGAAIGSAAQLGALLERILQAERLTIVLSRESELRRSVWLVS
ncbi:MAG: hypothetical protein QOJ13_2144 [Gaiellales bacterium]|jgi:hypothetical protein|nr:hypothetical protein [Gaiellales bacterium]